MLPTEIDWVVAPVFHRYDVAPDDVSVTELPGQNVVGPDAVIEAATGCNPESLTSSILNWMEALVVRQRIVRLATFGIVPVEVRYCHPVVPVPVFIGLIANGVKLVPFELISTTNSLPLEAVVVFKFPKPNTRFDTPIVFIPLIWKLAVPLFVKNTFAAPEAPAYVLLFDVLRMSAVPLIV